ncbi:hypothetical protein CPB86DRAFT_799454 [Serendipita vermifera]|nr:hypothetical protein CPB86DRAFT_799454 [Serendipita vermifera]
MPSHPLHSPNISQEELWAYYRTRSSPRHKRSLIEVSLHDKALVKFLSGPITYRFVDELVKTAASVIQIPSDTPPPTNLPTPPVTPVRNTFSRGQQRQSRNVAPSPSRLHPNWKPLDEFVLDLIISSKISNSNLAHALVTLDRLRERLPQTAQGKYGMACTRHRIFLAVLVVTCKYLNDSAPKNKDWAHFSRGLFRTAEITLMERQLLCLLDFDLHVSEEELATRFEPFTTLRRIQAREATGRKADAFVSDSDSLSLPITPITPNTPITPTSQKPVPASAPQSDVNDTPCNAQQEVIDAKPFVLQAVPSHRKRSERPNSIDKLQEEIQSMIIAISHSAPSVLDTLSKSDRRRGLDLEALALDHARLAPSITSSKSNQARRAHVASDRVSVAMPLTRSVSSDGILEGTGSFAMLAARTFSSSASSSMATSSSISTSTSTSNSEVATPGERVVTWLLEDPYPNGHPEHDLPPSLSLQYPQKRYPSGVDSLTHNSKLMTKLLGVGRSLSPTRRVGHGVRGDRKASTATIVPDEIRTEH